MENHGCILITGASSGIGRQLALDYAATGCHVWACGRNSERLEALEKTSHYIHALSFDIHDIQQTRSALSELSPVPTLWIFNAGDCEYIDDGVMDAELVKRVFQTNVIGLLNCIESSQHLYSQGHRLAIVGSIASEVALPRAEAYGASKAAVSYISRTLALDLHSKGIAVSTIFPGFVQTPLTDKNTFPMPMIVPVEQASQAIIKGLNKQKSAIYFPRRFTSILRFVALLPYAWQQSVVQKLLRSA